MRLDVALQPNGYKIVNVPIDIKTSANIVLIPQLTSPQTQASLMIDTVQHGHILPYTTTKLIFINTSDKDVIIPPSITTSIKIIPKIINTIQPQVNIRFFHAPFQNNFPKPQAYMFQYPNHLTSQIDVLNKLQNNIHDMDEYTSKNFIYTPIRDDALNLTHSIDNQYLIQPQYHSDLAPAKPAISKYQLQILSINSQIPIPFQEYDTEMNHIEDTQQMDAIKSLQLNCSQPQLPDIPEEEEPQAEQEKNNEPPISNQYTSNKEELNSWKRYYLSNLQLPFDLDPDSLPPLSKDQQQLIFHSTTLPHRQLTRDQLAALQQADDFCKTKLNDIQKLPTNRQDKPSGFYIFQGILCYYCVKNGLKQAKVVIPESVTMDLYRTLHAHYILYFLVDRLDVIINKSCANCSIAALTAFMFSTAQMSPNVIFQV